MSDLDVFETRFVAVYRRYLDEGPTDVDAVAVARAAIAAGGRARPSLWRTVQTRRLAWLILLGLVLTALALAMFAGATKPPVIGLACPPGAHPDVPGLSLQARPPLAPGAAPIVFDRRAGRIVLLVQSSEAGGQETWTFDVCSNSWDQMRPDREPADALQLVYDVDSDRTITLGLDRAWSYDLGADHWTAGSFLPFRMARQPRLVYDAATGLVIVLASTTDVEADPSELWTYDVDADAWSRLAQIDGPTVASAHEGLLAYDPSINRLVLFDRLTARTRQLDIAAGTWTTSNRTTPNVMFGYGPSGGEIAYDEGAGRLLITSYGRVIAGDARTGAWDLVVDGWNPDQPTEGCADDGPTCLSLPWLAYDPLNARVVVYGGLGMTGSGTGWVRSDQVLAFDLTRRAWRTLLEGSVLTPVS